MKSELAKRLRRAGKRLDAAASPNRMPTGEPGGIGSVSFVRWGVRA
jgi:hypothetical protein